MKLFNKRSFTVLGNKLHDAFFCEVFRLSKSLMSSILKTSNFLLKQRFINLLLKAGWRKRLLNFTKLF